MTILPGQDEQLETSVPSPQFDITAPNNNPLVASMPLTVSKVDDAVRVTCSEEADATQLPSVGSVFGRVAENVERYALRFPRSARAHTNFGMALAKSDRLDEAI